MLVSEGLVTKDLHLTTDRRLLLEFQCFLLWNQDMF